MRRGEVLAVRWKNVDLDRGMMRATESLDRRKPEFGSSRRNPIDTASSPCPPVPSKICAS
jgi:integrase